MLYVKLTLVGKMEGFLATKLTVSTEKNVAYYQFDIENGPPKSYTGDSILKMEIVPYRKGRKG